MKSVKPDVLSIFGAELSLSVLEGLMEKGVFTTEEAVSLVTKVADKNEALDKETSTSLNSEIAAFARMIAQELSES